MCVVGTSFVFTHLADSGALFCSHDLMCEELNVFKVLGRVQVRCYCQSLLLILLGNCSQLQT